MSPQLEEKLKQLPARSGVYFHKSADGEVIYVGKAAVLRNRVRQYFQHSRAKDAKTMALVAEIADTEWVETESEIDALFLESEMVKRYMPRYNILLRDDRSQMYVRIDMKSDWPTVTFTRNPADDGAEYYGPFFNGYALKKAIRHLRKVFPYLIRERRSGQSRLEEDLGLSPKRDDGSVAYKADLRKLISYIKGNRKSLTIELEKQMKNAADNQQFEQAAQLRNKLYHMKELQRRVMFGDSEFLDISKDRALGDLKEILGIKTELSRIESYDVSHLGGTNVVASMVVFTNGVSDRSEYRKFKVNERNDDPANMYQVIYRRLSPKNLRAWGTPDLLLIDGGVAQLQSALRAMRERAVSLPVVSIAKRADQLVVDMDAPGINIASIRTLADRHQNSVGITKSGRVSVIDLHLRGDKYSSHAKNLRASIDRPSGEYADVVYLIQRMRDEAHRFAIAYHATLRNQQTKKTLLDQVPGIGPTRRAALLRRFGSVAAILRASDDEVASVIGKKLTQRLRAYSH